MLQILAVDGKCKVCFIQITIAETHLFKQDLFADVLSVLHKVILKDVQLVEVEFVGLCLNMACRVSSMIQKFEINGKTHVEKFTKLFCP